jgi:hypothetical protein
VVVVVGVVVVVVLVVGRGVVVVVVVLVVAAGAGVVVVVVVLVVVGAGVVVVVVVDVVVLVVVGVVVVVRSVGTTGGSSATYWTPGCVARASTCELVAVTLSPPTMSRLSRGATPTAAFAPEKPDPKTTTWNCVAGVAAVSIAWASAGSSVEF